jgi:hypothetical protein
MPANAKTDEELIERFENASISPECFHHPEHVRVAFLYLRRYPLIDALQRFSTGLKRLAAALGKADRYHETITWAYMFLVNERMSGAHQERWSDFAAAHPDLLSWKESILKRYYSDETLATEKAKRQFVLPDKNL